MTDAPVARLAAIIDELVRAHRTASPPPRGLPYLGLEHASGTTFDLLDGLAARGIFRKYELVLDLGSGLGATSRWLAARLGCDVVGTTSLAAEASAASALTRRAGLAAQIRSATAAPGALPFRDSPFTHVWIHESLPRLAEPDRALAEAYGTLRRGGTLAVQDLVVDRVASACAVPGFHFATVEDRIAALRRIGFVDVEVRDRSGDAVERSAQVLAARDALHRRLYADPTLHSLLAEREALAPAIADGALRVIQILARRP